MNRSPKPSRTAEVRPRPALSHPVAGLVMAAAEGLPLRSTRPKPVHRLCGRPLVLHVLDALAPLRPDRTVVVVGDGAERVTKTIMEEAPTGIAVEVATQHERRGTGDAVAVGLTCFPDDEIDDPDDGHLLVLPGDIPLIRAETLLALAQTHERGDAAVTVLTADLAEPRGYGRIVRAKGGRVARVVEESAASDEERAITEVNTSVYCFRRSILPPALRRIQPFGRAGEYALPDLIEVLAEAGYPVLTHKLEDAREIMGVDDRLQLAMAEGELRRRTNTRWMALGVTMLDPERTYIDATVKLAADVTLFPGTMLQGATVIGPLAEIGPDTRLVDCVVGEGATVANTVARRAEIGAGASVGPFAALEPGSRVAPGSVTGPFFRGDTFG